MTDAVFIDEGPGDLTIGLKDPEAPKLWTGEVTAFGPLPNGDAPAVFDFIGCIIGCTGFVVALNRLKGSVEEGCKERRIK